VGLLFLIIGGHLPILLRYSCFFSEFEEDLLSFSGVFGGAVIAQCNPEFAAEGAFKPSSVNVIF